MFWKYTASDKKWFQKFVKKKLVIIIFGVVFINTYKVAEDTKSIMAYLLKIQIFFISTNDICIDMMRNYFFGHTEGNLKSPRNARKHFFEHIQFLRYALRFIY